MNFLAILRLVMKPRFSARFVCRSAVRLSASTRTNTARPTIPKCFRIRPTLSGDKGTRGQTPRYLTLTDLPGPNAWNFHPKLEDMRTCGDVQTTIICITECEIRRADPGPRFSGWLREMKPSKRLALRRRNLYSARRTAASGIEICVRVDPHSVGTVFDEDAAVGDCVIRQNLVPHRAASPGGHVQELFIRRKRDAVRIHARCISIAAEQRDFTVSDQKETAKR